MAKKYAEYADEITADELYKGLLAHGLFSEKLPPIFESESFYNFTKSMNHNFPNKSYRCICYESMRDINIPRTISIPHPMAYQRLCKTLAENWDKICCHFHDQTDEDSHKISRIHIRKLKDSEALFKMNYKNWQIDESPVPDIIIDKKFLVNVDISDCFHSMYTHSLTWAIAGKDYAKNNKKGSNWFDDLDKASMEINDDETQGFLIGPHASNILSEIILTVVDKRLSKKGWQYIRNIDDYKCYVKSYDEAQKFLVDLRKELRGFNLTLNHKKTKIEELPVTSDEKWVLEIKSIECCGPYGEVDYNSLRAYLDTAISIMQHYGGSAAILNYAIKVLSSQKFSNNAKKYYVKTVLHFASVYPYLLPLLDEYVFTPFCAPKELIQKFSRDMLVTACDNNNYEAASYAIFYAIKYNFDLPELSVEDIIDKQDCILCLMALLYFRREKMVVEENELVDYAENLFNNGHFDDNWLFVYEALPISFLNGDWKSMKKKKVSFVQSEFK